ncbi:DUF6363 domain-containing protein, partial [Salmonella enterica]|uniref:DUF6363 domain-containing protein n=1 Tax=Salmonella enterica TaxID=28901 RepID=UPI00398C7EC9
CPGESSLQPLVNLMRIHETYYRAIQQFIEQPAGKLRIIEIYPPQPLQSMALGSRIPALREDYKPGRLCGRYFLATVGKLLAATPPLLPHTSRMPVPQTLVVPSAPVANDTHVAEALNRPHANAPQFTVAAM